MQINQCIESRIEECTIFTAKFKSQASFEVPGLHEHHLNWFQDNNETYL